VVRAAPLSPEARRASIVAATLPLLRIHGRDVTTSQIAMAAGVAEGTLFRVFPDKEALIEAAIASAFDPAPGEAELARIDRGLALRDKLIEAIEILQRRVSQIWQLISVMRLPAPPPERTRPPPHVDDTRLRAQLVVLFEPHRAELRCPPEQAARLFRALAFAGSHPRIIDQPLTPHELVTLLLDGITARDEEP
jgi:AcrR family transcriptional regulator